MQHETAAENIGAEDPYSIFIPKKDAQDENHTHNEAMVKFVGNTLSHSLKSCKKRSEKPISNSPQKASNNTNNWPK